MKRIAIALLISSFAAGSALAANSCETKAMSKDGKMLSGAAKMSSMKKCCEDSAKSADGKMLSGAAKTSYMKKCESGA